LILDAYRAGAEFNLQVALERDFYAHPDHYYRWRNARSSPDMWRYFAYTGQILDPQEPYLPGDIVFFDWEQDGVIDHVSLISEVNSRGRPRKMIDATGVIDDNPSGLTAQLDWRPFHDQHVAGHARWLGVLRSSPPGDPPDSVLLVALNSSQVRLRLLDAAGRAIQSGLQEIEAGSYQDMGNGAVISLRDPAPGGWYFIELSSAQEATFQLGVQLIQGGEINASNYLDEGSISAGEVRILGVQVETQGGKTVFSIPNLVP
jgi:hypothetical protein